MAEWEFDGNTAPASGAVWATVSGWASDGASIVADPAFATSYALRIDTPADGDDQFIELEVVSTAGDVIFATHCEGAHSVNNGYTYEILNGNSIRRWRNNGYNGDLFLTLPATPFTIRLEVIGDTRKLYINGVEVDSQVDGSPLTNGGVRSYQEIGSKGGRIGHVTAGDLGSAPPAEPDQITDLSAVPYEDHVDLDWTAPADNGDPITDYVIQWAPDSSGSPGTWTTISDGTSTTTSYSHTGLTIDTIYWYRVAAVNGIDQGLYSTAVSALTAEGPGVWEDVTPAGATMDPDDPSAGANYGFQSIAAGPDGTVYAVEDYHGLFRSSDGGETWDGPFQVGATPGTCWTVQVDPFDANIVWANSGFGSGGPLKSTDQGETWTKFPVGSPTALDDVYCIAMDPYLEGHMLVTWHTDWSSDTSSGVSESFDGGETWTNHNAPDDAWDTGHAVFFLSDSDTWLVGTQVNGFWRTDDGGTTWDQVSTIHMTHGATNFLTKVGATLIVATDDGVMISTDDGVTWTDASTGLSGDSYSTVATDGNHLYTAPSFPLTPHYSAADGPWKTRPISSGPWVNLVGSPDPQHGANANGPRQKAVTDDYIFTSNYMAGVWRMALASEETPTTQFFQFL